jgi:hypothetical protein
MRLAPKATMLGGQWENQSDAESWLTGMRSSFHCYSTPSNIVTMGTFRIRFTFKSIAAEQDYVAQLKFPDRKKGSPFIIDEFAEDGAQLICSQNKTNAHTQNASEGPRADKFTSDNAKCLHDSCITDHSHNI